MASMGIVDVRKAYGEHAVIHGVSVDIPDGEFVILVGPSGCGKSTLLRMVAGLETISSGEIRIDGRIVNALPPKDRDIAMVFQSYALYPHKTVAQNMGFALKMRGEAKAEIDSRVKNAARILDLEPYLDRLPRQLSGGQRQRVAMGRAIVRSPKVFLFDEPLSNLDAKLRVQMRAEIRELQRRLATTMIYVTHDQVEAMTMADKIVVLRDGRVEQIGSPLELYDRPANSFVGSFIGSPSMNILKGRLHAGPTPSVVMADGTMLPLLAAPAGSDGRPVLYGIRPEHFTHGPGTQAEVILVETTGAETQVVARFGGERVTAVFHDRFLEGPGTMIPLTPDPGRVHLFDAETGARLIG